MNRINLPINFRNFTSLFTVFSFLFFITITPTVLWPKFQEIQGVKENIEAKEAEIKTAEEYFSDLEKTKTKLEEYQTEIAKIDSALPDDPSVPTFFDFLQKVSSQSGLILERLSSFVTAPSTNFPGFQETVFSFDVRGSYSSLKNFVSVLEKSARLIEMENIAFASAVKSEINPPKEKDLFTFSLRVRVYSY